MYLNTYMLGVGFGGGGGIRKKMHDPLVCEKIWKTTENLCIKMIRLPHSFAKKQPILSIHFANEWINLFRKRVGWEWHLSQTSGSKMAPWVATRLQAYIGGMPPSADFLTQS